MSGAEATGGEPGRLAPGTGRAGRWRAGGRGVAGRPRLADWAVMKRPSIAGTRLGALEAQVLEALWAAGGPVGARELAGMLPGPRRAYTTVVTVLTHLVAKGLAERTGDGRRYLYRAAGDPDQLTAQAIGRLLAAATDRRAVLAHLIEQAQDPGLLDELAALLRENRS
jgi:predicted transcriptional regulator